jgi:hypothetical protein
VIAYRATLDVPRELVQFAAALLAAERRRRGELRGSRALTCFWQAVLGLRWFRDRTAPEALARDHGISRATAYRYVDEVIAVLAGQAPDLREALERAKDDGLAHVILDGKIIAPSATSPPAPARSATPPAPPSSSPISSTATSPGIHHPQSPPVSGRDSRVNAEALT